MIERIYLVIEINKKYGFCMTLEIQKKITKDYFLIYEKKSMKLSYKCPKNCHELNKVICAIAL